MIPLSFSPALLWLLAGSTAVLALAVVIGLAIVAVTRRRRVKITGWRRYGLYGFFALAGMLSVPAAFNSVAGLWLVAGGLRQAWMQRTTLDQPRLVAHIDMPADTRLILRRGGELSTFETATFPDAVPVFGYPTRRVRRVLLPADDGRGYIASTAELSLAADVVWAGWRCQKDTPMKITLRDGGAVDAVHDCVLAAGNRVQDIRLPAGSHLRRTEGTMYVSGRRGADRWVVTTPDHAEAQVNGMGLDANLYIDAARRLRRVRGTLAAPLTLGGVAYPAGTSVRLRYAPDTGRPNEWWLNPGPAPAVRDADGQRIGVDKALRHDADGRLRDVVPRREAGFYRIRPLQP